MFKKLNQYNLISSQSDKNITVEIKVAAQAHRADSRRVSVILRVGRVGAHELGCGRGQHDPRQAVVLVKGVQGPSGDAGQRGAVQQAVWVGVGGCSRALLCCWVIPGVGPRPVGLQLGVMHQLRGDVGLAGVSQGVLHRPLQLHPPVLEPVSDLERRKKSHEEKFSHRILEILSISELQGRRQDWKNTEAKLLVGNK